MAASNRRPQVNATWYEKTSVMGALGMNGIIAPLIYKGTLKGEFFTIYIKECLMPTMKKGDTLILDNLSAHKVKGAIQPLIDKGINVVFLPVYSQDFNPIEHAWSKVKACLRKAKAITRDTLIPAITEALDAIKPKDIENWIRHCGYGLQ
ncbi:MAG: transposase [Holophagales bacterium]|jgi:transposase|nr:transposase [Holophagales bacterium]